MCAVSCMELLLSGPGVFDGHGSWHAVGGSIYACTNVGNFIKNAFHGSGFDAARKPAHSKWWLGWAGQRSQWGPIDCVEPCSISCTRRLNCWRPSAREQQQPLPSLLSIVSQYGTVDTRMNT
jgi:hypothetical protein